MRTSLAAVCTAAVLLAGCGGGGSSLAPAQAPVTGSPSSPGLQTIKVTVVLGGKSGATTSAVRQPKFISPSTNGIDMQVFAHGGSTVIGESKTDISSGSAACGGQTGLPRTCIISVPAPAGSDDITGTTFDAAPLSNAFGPSAHVLGIGRLNGFNVITGQTNSFSLFISGVINALGFLPPNASLPADGSVHTLGFVLNPADFDANPITAGPNDPYQNPITVQLTESGGSGHVQIVKNGTPTGGMSTTLNRTTDTVAVQYDGGGAVGYSATVSVSASNVTPETLVLSPMFITSSSGFAGTKSLTFSAPGQTAVVHANEAGGAPGTQYTADDHTCAGVASASAFAAGPNSSATVSAIGSGSCTIAFSDGASTITWNVSVSTTIGSISVPGFTMGPITFANYGVGPIQGQSDSASGKPWLSNSCGGNDYDANVVNTSSYPSSHWPGTPPTRALQFSNAVTQGCFSGLGTPVTPHAAGYPNALADESTATPAICGSDCQPFFSEQFVVTSATGGFQPSLEMSISPVYNNQGARMSYVGLWHGQSSGGTPKLIVFAYDVEGIFPGLGPAPCFQCANFVIHEIAEVDPTVPHTIGVTMQFVQPNADVVKYYVDGVQSSLESATSFRSWEDYYFFDTESDPGFTHPVSRAVNDLLFRAGNVDTCLNFDDLANNCNQRMVGPTTPVHTSNAGNGFLFTNITTCAGTATVCAPAIQTSGSRRAAQGVRAGPVRAVHNASLLR